MDENPCLDDALTRISRTVRASCVSGVVEDMIARRTECFLCSRVLHFPADSCWGRVFLCDDEIKGRVAGTIQMLLMNLPLQVER